MEAKRTARSWRQIRWLKGGCQTGQSSGRAMRKGYSWRSRCPGQRRAPGLSFLWHPLKVEFQAQHQPASRRRRSVLTEVLVDLITR